VSHPDSVRPPLLLLAVATISGGLVGGGIGLFMSLPNPFVLFITLVGMVCGAASGFISMLVGLVVYGLTQRLRRPNLRWCVVSGSAAVGASGILGALLSQNGISGAWPLVAVAFVVSGAAALLAYPSLHRTCGPGLVA
jgi:hypothetical protein